MKVVEEKISISELKEMASRMFGNLVKAAVDVERGILVVDADLHSDEETYLLNNGSKQENIWGINIYPNEDKEKIYTLLNLIAEEISKTFSIYPNYQLKNTEIKLQQTQRVSLLDMLVY